MIVVADTSGLLAAFDEEEEAHLDARAVMEHEALLISPLVLTELDHLVQRDFHFEDSVRVIDGLITRLQTGQYKLANLGVADLVDAHTVRATYPSLELDLADCVGVVLADKHDTNLIFTLDQGDFRAIRPLTARFDAFRLLPADG